MMDKTVGIHEIDNSEIARSFECSSDDLSKNMHLKSSDIAILTQNIRSIYKNFTDLESNLTLLKIKLDVLVLTECRLTQSKNVPNLIDYNSYATTSHLNQNDGVTTYVKTCHNARVKEIFLIQASCLQIILYNIVILCIYRSPSNNNAENFIESLNKHLDCIKKYDTIIIVGDININTLPRETERGYEKNNRLNYLNVLSMHGLLPGHNLPTREDACLDHVILKLHKQKNVATIAVVHTTITDHLTIVINISKVKTTNSSKFKTTTDYDKAVKYLTDCNITNLLQLNEPNYLCEKLINIIQESISKFTKIIRVPRSKQIIKPWITQGILRCIINRNNMQKKLRNNPNDEIHKITYRRYRNYCNNLIKKLKRRYEREQLYKNYKNSKDLWNTVNKITHYKPKKTPNLQLIDIKASPTASVNYVNKYFATIGKDLAQRIAVVQQKTANPLFQIRSPVSSFVLLDTDPIEVNMVIMNLKSESAPGLDNIPTRFLKQSKTILIPIICQLVSLCFSKGIFPRALKKAIITPVYKNGNRDEINNYRPISVLPSISKILEKLINSRLLKYLNKLNILSDSQYGFRNGRSTEDATAALTNYIVEQVDNKKKCLTVFLDLKKAFDTVSIPILIHKLEKNGIRGTPLDLLSDYLHERKQRVKVGEVVSEDEDICYGVPQGSVLGPTLFLLYINDLCNLQLNDAKIFSYADDTAIVFTGKSWDDVKFKAEAGLSLVSEWLSTNSLTLNVSKTNFMTFTMYNNTQPDSDFTIKIHVCNRDDPLICPCPKINKVKSTKYLGIMIDQRLSWHAHIELLMNRVRKLIWIFKGLRHSAPKPLLNQIYVALAESVLNYCITVWGGATKTKFIDVERAQRALLKVMYFRPYRYPTQSLYSNSGLLSIRKLYILQTVLKIHKSIEYDPNKVTKRRKDKIVNKKSVKSNFAARQFPTQAAHLYNIINKKQNIFALSNYECKLNLIKWLMNLNYDETEALIN